MRCEVRIDNVSVRRADNRCFGVMSGGLSGWKKGEMYREWSFAEVSFKELRNRGDLPEDKPQLMLEAADFLRPEDTQVIFGKRFGSSGQKDEKKVSLSDESKGLFV